MKKTITSAVLALSSILLGMKAQAQTVYPGCINEAVTNGALIASTTASSNSVQNWNQSLSATNYWKSGGNPNGYRDGIIAINADVTSGTSARLYQYVSNVAVEDDSLTIILIGSISTGTNRLAKLGVFWSPGSSGFNKTNHSVAEVRQDNVTYYTTQSFNNAHVDMTFSTSNLSYFLKVRIPYSGSGPVNGTLSLLPESISGSGMATVFLNSVYMPGHSCTPPPSVQQPFDCNAGYAYLIQDSDGGNAFTVEGRAGLYRINVATGASTLVHPYLIDFNATNFVQMNAMGYNPVDNFLWARRFGTDQIVRIGADGTTRFYTIPSLYGNHGAADISASGIYYLYDQYRKVLDRIDLNTMTLLPSIPLSSSARNSIIDIAINPLDNMMYAAPINGGTTYVQRINPVTGVTVDLYNTVISGNGFGALYFDNEGNLYGSMNNTGEIWKFPTTTPYAASFLSNGPSTSSNDGARCPIKVVATINISGKVWNDVNGDAITNGTEIGINPETLYANLVNDTGAVVSSILVATNGTYLFSNVEATGVYSVILTNSVQPLNSTLSASETLPETWSHTGTNVGGVGNTNNQTGMITGITTGGNDVTNLNFGIQRPPNSNSVLYILPAEPIGGSSLPLNGGSNAPLMSGSDPEDGNYTGNTGTVRSPQGVVITSLPSNGELWYDGVEVTTADVANSTLYTDPSKFSIKFVGNGYTNTIFQYAYVDAAGAQDPSPADYELRWTTPVPISLQHFDAYKRLNDVELVWITAKELNNKEFEIQRSAEGKNWQHIGTVKSLTKDGNSNSILKYQFIDKSVLKGQNFYRLKQIDFDGKYEYSNVQSVFHEDNNSLSIYPNPTNDILVISGLTGHKSIVIFNTLGEKIMQLESSDYNTTIKLSELPDGIYHIHVITDTGFKKVERIVKMK